MSDKYSDPDDVLKKAKKYLGDDVEIFISSRKGKKYMVKNPDGKLIHFGALGYEDFTKHKDNKRRDNYLKRATKIRGNWKDNKYSPNNLSINILW
tara:strand:- start:287 stop:571 length:285 start_codon:yes stop_codon:yes gene_type:complete